MVDVFFIVVCGGDFQVLFEVFDFDVVLRVQMAGVLFELRGAVKVVG